MTHEMFAQIFSAFGLSHADSAVVPFGNGLINHTWLVTSHSNELILQKINQQIFTQPTAIAENINNIATFLSVANPNYLFVAPQKTLDQQEMFHLDSVGYFRMYPFVNNTHTIDVVTHPQQAYEAAKQFGRFTKMLNHFPVAQLKITLPHFHDLGLRYQQFENALKNGNAVRIEQSISSITFLQAHKNIVDTYIQICKDENCKKRVTHHDTKISNVLFDQNDNGICVIDLDTVMPGYFMSDVGDMLRTYLSPVSEEEKDCSLIEIREEYFKAIAAGYLGEMKDELTTTEKQHFVYAGKMMIYMQALRFLTDHLNNDVYYGAKYEGHNFLRAKNQITLLQKLIEKEDVLHKMLKKEILVDQL